MKQMTTMRYKLQRGFSLITAIFLLVVLASLGAVMMTFFTAQQQSSALDVMGARAYQASRAGIEWGAYQVLQNASGITCATPLPASAVNTVLMPSTTTLQGFTVTVYCGKLAVSEAAATVTIYQITSTAKQGAVATPDYVERQMSVTIAQ